MLNLNTKVLNILNRSTGRALTYGAIAKALHLDYRTNSRYFNIQYALQTLIKENKVVAYKTNSNTPYAPTVYSCKSKSN